MIPIQPSECLTALLIGIHYAKPRFTVSNFFNEILEAVVELPRFEICSQNTHELVFRIGSIKVSLNPESLIVNSVVAVGKELIQLLPKLNHDSGIMIPILPHSIYDAKFDLPLGHQFSKENAKAFRKNFKEEGLGIIRLVDKIIQGGLPSFRFTGLVEYYAIPLSAVQWDILEKFNQGAEIQGAVNTEKTAVNRYYFPAMEEEDERCLIFRLEKPNDYCQPNRTVGGATFDFQIVPRNPKTLAEFGGTGEMLTTLFSGMDQVIQQSRFLSFKQRS